MDRSSGQCSPGAFLSLVFVVVQLASCTPPGGPPRRPEPADERPLPSAEPSTSVSSAEAGLGPRAIPPDPRTPTVEVEDPSGKPRQGPEAALLPMRQQMRECTSGKNGVVRVRIKTDKNRTSMDIEPGSSLDGATHRCVLESLSTVDVDDVLGRVNPSDRPSGFTSVLRVEW